MNAPRTVEGQQVWDITTRMRGQIRLGPMGGMIGWDLNVAFQMATALGTEAVIIAEMLPSIEEAMIRILREQSNG